jgi:hypothetical protein
MNVHIEWENPWQPTLDKSMKLLTEERRNILNPAIIARRGSSLVVLKYLSYSGRK